MAAATLRRESGEERIKHCNAHWPSESETETRRAARVSAKQCGLCEVLRPFGFTDKHATFSVVGSAIAAVPKCIRIMNFIRRGGLTDVCRVERTSVSCYEESHGTVFLKILQQNSTVVSHILLINKEVRIELGLHYELQTRSSKL